MLRSLCWCIAGGLVLVFATVLAIRTYRPNRPADDAGGPDRGKRRSAVPAQADGRAPPLPALSPSPYLNTGPAVKFVGIAVCRDCHDAESASFEASSHSHSLSPLVPLESPPNGVVDHPLSRRSYRIERVGDEMWHRESVLRENGARTEIAAYPVKYQVGSGHVAKSYFIEDDGFLVQSPVTWFAKEGRWDMSPGYDAEDQWSFSRTIRRGCLYCHAGQVEDSGSGGLRYRIEETSIGCERCHGPGELHVSRQRSGRPAAGNREFDESIVNPSRLSRELSESICAQCHLNGEVAATVRGRKPEDFRPGLPLREFRLEFRTASSDEGMRVAGHVEQLHQSRCYQNSTTLTCITCHAPHDTLPRDEHLARQRGICADCHQQHPCGLALEQRQQSNGDNCMHCHMPRAETEVTHVALTDHRIGIHPEHAASDEPLPQRDELDLIPLQPLDHLAELDQKRSLGLANLALVRMSGKAPEQIPRLMHASSLLRSAFEGGIHDPETLTALAGIARDTEQLSIGFALAGRALLSPEITNTGRLETMDLLAEFHVRLGRPDRAEPFLRELAGGTRSAHHWHLLGQIEYQLGRRDRAIVAAREAVNLEPGRPEYRQSLLLLLQEAGQVKEADEQRELVELLSPPGP